MIRRLFMILASLACVFSLSAARHEGSVYVDKQGVMRSTADGKEVSFYGVNYTLPFAYAYRAVKAVGVEPREAIDRDVYHIARLGLNAYRIHIWDVEITDSLGNLIENEHLDLLDYLISRLEQRGISIILTAQTNFGNGYPERKQPTGGYSYNYEKCRMHDTEACVRAQERYAESLVRHKNPYTGLTYSADNGIIALEINNEPCHSGTPEAATAYINRMVKALRKGGFRKPLLYNVSHNLTNHTAAFFKADIQGTTYQWYPTGLVSGHTRKGNFLPNVEEYNIPFSSVKGFEKMARVVYEFDPGDIIDSYLYPAVVRSFRSAGFQWITQFAYDPIDIADVNTEYQTHYLNLAYTPGKAIGMKIASQVAQQVNRGEKFGTYPQDTIFGDFSVSYMQNLAMLNDGKHYFHTNRTDVVPKDEMQIEEVAGVGSSPLVAYDGTGAYFIDKIGADTWRLEVMPDVFIVADPFAKPSPSRKVAVTVRGKHAITLHLPGLAKKFSYKGINEGNSASGTASECTFTVAPGVYVVGNSAEAVDTTSPEMKLRNFAVGEYVTPNEGCTESMLLHTPSYAVEAGKSSLTVNATVAGIRQPDSVVVYPKHISFWNDRNPLYRMRRVGSYDYEVELPIDRHDKENVEYNIVVFDGARAITYPQAMEGTPLSWDFTDYRYYSTRIVNADAPLVLIGADAKLSDIEMASIPNYSRISGRFLQQEPVGRDAMQFSMVAGEDSTRFYLRKYVGDIVAGMPGMEYKTRLCVSLGAVDGVQALDVALITTTGITYRKRLKVCENGIIRLDLSELSQDYTALIPAPYPDFLTRSFSTPQSIPLKQCDVEQVELSTPPMKKEAKATIDVRGVWLE